jgi:hypothetical protein
MISSYCLFKCLNLLRNKGTFSFIFIQSIIFRVSLRIFVVIKGCLGGFSNISFTYITRFRQIVFHWYLFTVCPSACWQFITLSINYSLFSYGLHLANYQFLLLPIKRHYFTLFLKYFKNPFHQLLT